MSFERVSISSKYKNFFLTRRKKKYYFKFKKILNGYSLLIKKEMRGNN